MVNIGATISAIRQALADCVVWETEVLEGAVRDATPYCHDGDFDFPVACMLLRVALTYSTKSPPVFEAASILGRREVLLRLERQMPVETLAQLRLVETDLIEFIRARENP